MENEVEIRIRPAYVFVTGTFILISTLIGLSSKISIYIRAILIGGFLIFLILNGYRKIIFRGEYLEINYPLISIKKRIKLPDIIKVKLTKGARAPFPFSFKVYYKNIDKSKSFGFDTEKYDVVTKVLVQLIKHNVNLELGSNDVVNAYYRDAMELVKKEKSNP